MIEEYTGASDIAKALPGPLELSRMHEAKLKRCYKQYGILGALIRQIMVGRVVTVPANSASARSEPCEVTDIKLQNGNVRVFGRPKDKRRSILLCEGLASITIVEGVKP